MLRAVPVVLALLAPAGCASPGAGCAVDLAECRESGCNGWVIVKFDVDDAGKVVNERATAACPAGFFEDAALDAVRNWKFPVDQAGRSHKVRLEFDKEK
jgi:protein TonB